MFFGVGLKSYFTMAPPYNSWLSYWSYLEKNPVTIISPPLTVILHQTPVGHYLVWWKLKSTKRRTRVAVNVRGKNSKHARTHRHTHTM